MGRTRLVYHSDGRRGGRGVHQKPPAAPLGGITPGRFCCFSCCFGWALSAASVGRFLGCRCDTPARRRLTRGCQAALECSAYECSALECSALHLNAVPMVVRVRMIISESPLGMTIDSAPADCCFLSGSESGRVISPLFEFQCGRRSPVLLQGKGQRRGLPGLHRAA